MSEFKYDVSAVLTAHCEGVLAGMSFHSLLDSVVELTKSGYKAEIIVMLDCADEYTSMIFDSIECEYDIRIVKTEYADQGQARNHAADLAKGQFIAFLDGDDLWSFNWLSTSMEMAENTSVSTIFHPSINWFFGEVSSLVYNIERTEDCFESAFLRVANYWDAMCFTHTDIHRRYSYSKREIQKGFAFEDWYWNCLTLDNGIDHVVVPNTIHFKRRREGSQTREASGSKSLPPLTDLHLYRIACDEQSVLEAKNAK